MAPSLPRTLALFAATASLLAGLSFVAMVLWAPRGVVSLFRFRRRAPAVQPSSPSGSLQ